MISYPFSFKKIVSFCYKCNDGGVTKKETPKDPN